MQNEQEKGGAEWKHKPRNESGLTVEVELGSDAHL